ncbi:hypothetical protein L2E82_22185 [Cichorium intybus]|uniref:Uncharacterized protein n=1 Tax=Cichorium intybus TaxID=13427 RepID=A0ACB9DWS3_CICIN|nr:hypothetical protein L2E82_22185 [Cichorium intybus]
MESLNMVRCRGRILQANIARFLRQPPPHLSKSLYHPNPPRSTFKLSFRDGRSFADAVSGRPGQASLIGETRFLETVSHIQSLIAEEGFYDVQIIGIPIHAWFDNNFDSIASNYGKVIVNENSMDTCQDLSFGKVGVLSAIRTKINEEIVVCIDGANHRVGVMECNENWCPFSFGSDNGSLASSEDDDGFISGSDDEVDDVDGISDTWVQNNEKPEDGEIIADNKAPDDHSFSFDKDVDHMVDPLNSDHALVVDDLVCGNNVGGLSNPVDESMAPRSPNGGPSWPIDPSWAKP